MGTQVAADTTAFAMRRKHFIVEMIAAWDESKVRSTGGGCPIFSKALAPSALLGGYSNFLAPDAHEQIGDAYGNNAPCLRELKRQFDPDDVLSSATPLPI